MKALLIAEKKSVSDAIKTVYEKIKPSLGVEITFAYAAGHLVRMCEPDEYEDKNWGKPWKKESLPIIPQSIKYKLIEGKEHFYKKIENEWKTGNYDLIINAGDAGREGQLVQSLIYRQLGVPRDFSIKRMWLSDTTDESIEKELRSLRDNRDFARLEAASKLRALLDWEIGMNFSRAATIALGRRAVIGRVFTSVMYLIEQREREIENFRPKKYYEVEAEFTCESGSYKGRLFNPAPVPDAPTPYAYFSKNEAAKKLNIIDKTAFVSEVTETEKSTYAPELYNLTDLQKDAARHLNLTPAETLDIAESLYMKKVLSYPRTESRHLSAAQKTDVRKIIDYLKSEGYSYTDIISDADVDRVFSTSKYVNDKKVSDHPALIPTGKKAELTDNEKKIYDFVVRRFTAIFLPPRKTVEQRVITEIGDMKFCTTGTKVVDMGYTVLQGKNTDDSICPVSESQMVSVTDKKIESRETSSPKRYTYESLLTAMETAGRDIEEYKQIMKETAGLGTPATRAEIIAKAENSGYIVTDKKSIRITGEGRQLITVLWNFDFIGPVLTAKWETELSRIENGKAAPEQFIGKMNSFIEDNTKKLLLLDNIGAYHEQLNSKCPKCENEIWAYHGYYACAGKEAGTCDFSLPKKVGGALLTKEDIEQILSGKASGNKKFVWKDGKKTQGRLCLDENLKLTFSKNIVGKCPVCGNNIIEGNNSYYCIKYKWDSEIKKSSGCPFSVYKKCGETIIPANVAVEVFANGISKSTKKITFKSGKFYNGYITCQSEADDTWHFKAVSDVGKVCNCPFCDGGDIVENIRYYECSNNKTSCDFRIEKKFFHATITADDIRTMFYQRLTVTKKININGASTRKELKIIKTEKQGYKYVWDTIGKVRM